ncbi:hypothetical protein [Pantoea agglomerans]
MKKIFRRGDTRLFFASSGLFVRKKNARFSALSKKPALDQNSKNFVKLLTWLLALEKRGLRKYARLRSVICTENQALLTYRKSLKYPVSCENIFAWAPDVVPAGLQQLKKAS